MKPSLSFALLLLAAVPALGEKEVRKEFRHQLPAAGITAVRVEIPIAEIRLVNGSAGTIELDGSIGQKYSYRDEREWAESIVDATSIRVEVRGSRLVVRRELAPPADRWKAKRSPASIRAVLRVPEGMSVEVDQSIGEIELDGAFGDIDVDLRIGELKVRTPKAHVRELSASARVGEVRARLGDRIITREGLFAGETLYENETGRSFVRLRVRIGEIDVRLTEGLTAPPPRSTPPPHPASAPPPGSAPPGGRV